MVEEDQLQGKGKEKIMPHKRNDFRSERYSNNHPRRDFAGQSGSTNMQAVNTVFREPVQRVLEKVKNEPFFKWSNKMARDSSKRIRVCIVNTTKDCRNLWNHLNQLVREGKLRHLLHPSSGHPGQANQEPRRDISLRPSMGTINVILAAPGRTDYFPSKVMSVARLSTEDNDRESKRSRKGASPVLGFLDEDKIGTIQPHDDALVVTLRIGGFDVKRVLVNQGSAMEVMYPDLYKGLNLKPEDLKAYDSPLVSFEGKTVTPKGQIRLPIQTGSNVVKVDFIVVDAYSLYTAIVARPWLHALGAVYFTLHQKVKYPSEGRVEQIIGNQAMARQCIVAAISRQSNAEPSAPTRKDL
ncbi:uncharacterized protein LOC115974119 [Quercus lobata]|uniref:uncharacterized protein LOC115974119 n=1 Tax=Quercus lobata TaxID=97700 RepID=UPI0012469A1D|nr:uncharacterized protein LOC115974119 [Quercus lobata]